MKNSFLIICFVLIGQHLLAQNNTKELYKVSLEKYLHQEHKAGSHTLVVFGDTDTSWLSEKIGKTKIIIADSIFFTSLNDTTFECIKLFPIAIVGEKVVTGISRFKYKLEGSHSNIVFISSYYFFFRYNCTTRKFVFDKYKNESI